jgi:hypothetical protein
MLKAERFRLHAHYATPGFKYGAVVQDFIRGPVRIVGLSDSRIPWPIGQKGRANEELLLVLGIR